MELTTVLLVRVPVPSSFMMSKIQNLNGTHNLFLPVLSPPLSFMMSKIQNLNGTHNWFPPCLRGLQVVYDVKDTKFEWNSQQVFQYPTAQKGRL